MKSIAKTTTVSNLKGKNGRILSYLRLTAMAPELRLDESLRSNRQMTINLQTSSTHGTKRLALLDHQMCVRSRSRPYPHLRLHPVLHPNNAARALRWLQQSNIWRREMRSFSRHESFALTPDVVPTEAEPAVSPNLLRELRGLLQSRLSVALKPYSLIEAHRTTEQDHIGPHTDEAVHEVRVALNLNSGWIESYGGVLSLQDRPLHPRKRVDYCPFHNSATAFRTTATSYHQVSRVKEGPRYTLLYRFPIDPAFEAGAASRQFQGSSRGSLPMERAETVIVVVSNPYRWPAV